MAIPTIIITNYTLHSEVFQAGNVGLWYVHFIRHTHAHMHTHIAACTYSLMHTHPSMHLTSHALCDPRQITMHIEAIATVVTMGFCQDKVLFLVVVHVVTNIVARMHTIPLHSFYCMCPSCSCFSAYQIVCLCGTKGRYSS